jgi:NAD-dependent SIR2 family protein deacetylase
VTAPPVAAALDQAASAIARARAVLVTAGAGMGVDSGLPDFRGPEGFWRAYPPFRALGLRFEAIAQPHWFASDPALAWGFYGHRLALYRATVPHPGFQRLRALVGERPLAVFTSNVDGQFAAAGWDPERTWECHGSLHWLQCTRVCRGEVWPADGVTVAVDPATFRAEPPFPRCSHCGAIARPNVLMFNDALFADAREQLQAQAIRSWLGDHLGPDLTVVELGAGTGVPTVRGFGERLAARGATLVRINPRESHGPRGTIAVALAAAEATEALALRVTGANG